MAPRIGAYFRIEGKRYQYIRGIGKGSFATCWKVRDNDGSYFACKITPLSSRFIERSRREIEIHRSLVHPHIVRFVSAGEDADSLYIVMELCEQTLDSFLNKKLGRAESNGLLLKQIAYGLAYIHENNLVHRDLNPKNVLLTANSTTAKIADFGFAAESNALRERCGTVGYVAPEIYACDIYDSKVDVYSLGMIAREMSITVPENLVAVDAEKRPSVHRFLTTFG